MFVVTIVKRVLQYYQLHEHCVLPILKKESGFDSQNTADANKFPADSQLLSFKYFPSLNQNWIERTPYYSWGAENYRSILKTGNNDMQISVIFPSGIQHKKCVEG
jgi:hypothetical protein